MSVQIESCIRRERHYAYSSVGEGASWGCREGNKNSGTGLGLVGASADERCG